jgi:hypothetical protein
MSVREARRDVVGYHLKAIWIAVEAMACHHVIVA